MKKLLPLALLLLTANICFSQIHLPTKVKEVKVPEKAKMLTSNTEKPESIISEAETVLYRTMKTNESIIYSVNMPIEDVIKFYINYLKFMPNSLCIEDTVLVSDLSNSFNSKGGLVEEAEDGIHHTELQITYYNMLKDKKKNEFGKELRNNKARKLICDSDLISSAMIIIKNPIKGHKGSECYDIEISIKDKTKKDPKNNKYSSQTEIFIGGYSINE